MQLSSVSPVPSSTGPVDDQSSAMDAGVHVVVPCFRESGRINAFLLDLCEHMTALGGCTVLVVEDGSGAEEAARMNEIVEAARRQYPCLQPLLSIPQNQGKGNAVYTGWKNHHGGGWLAFVDADGASSASEVARLIGLARAQPPSAPRALFASRILMLGHHVDRTLGRHLIGRIYAGMVAGLLHLPVYDSQCGLKLVPRKAFEAVAHRLTIHGFAFDVELLCALLDADCPILEVPIDWHEVAGGKVRLVRDSIRMFNDILDVRRRRTSPEWVAPAAASVLSKPMTSASI